MSSTGIVYLVFCSSTLILGILFWVLIKRQNEKYNLLIKEYRELTGNPRGYLELVRRDKDYFDLVDNTWIDFKSYKITSKDFLILEILKEL